MMINEQEIADLIYQFPWLLDDRFIIPNINGSLGMARKVNVGRNGFSREVDLLFKDTRDNRPVIVEVNNSCLTCENLARVLEYRSLINSMDEEAKSRWQNEFGCNYFAPRMILVSAEASDEVVISANLAGVQVRLFQSSGAAALNFTDIEHISDKLGRWNNFIKSGNRTLLERQTWVKNVFRKIKTFIDNYQNEDITTISNLCTTNLKNSYVRGQVFPFLNIPIRYQDKELLGLYEFFNEELYFDERFIYCDFVIEHSYYNANKDEDAGVIMHKVRKALEKMGYDVIAFEGGMATVKIERQVLENDDHLFMLLDKLIKDALVVQEEILK